MNDRDDKGQGQPTRQPPTPYSDPATWDQPSPPSPAKPPSGEPFGPTNNPNPKAWP